jgi:glycosyl transferase family 25
MFKIVFIILLFILLIIIMNFENFININNYLIDYQVIHMTENYDRVTNIENMSNKINKKITYFEAIKGKNVDLNDLTIYDENIKFNFNYRTKGEIGCYLSHLMLLKNLKNSNFQYCLILEDDFNIINDNFNDELSDIINKIDTDFDLIFLGNLNNNHGEIYKDNIYYVNKNQYLWGTHGYLVNIKNINKIYDNLLNFNLAIDNKYKELINNNILNAYIIYPVIIGINNYNSTVGIIE